MSNLIRLKECSNINIENCKFYGENDSLAILCDNTSNINMKENKFECSKSNNDKRIIKINENKKKRGLNSKCLCGSGYKIKDCCIEILEKLNLNKSKNICLVIGNGFNISARNYLKTIGNELDMNTADFFNWQLESISNNEKLRNDFPVLNKYLDSVEYGESFKKVQELNNYANERLLKDKEDKEVNILICELKYYIVIAFSYFQRELDKKDISKWGWVKVLKLLKDKLSYIVSFNYELLLELALENANISYRRIGILEEQNGIGILKPHGSIDFDIKGVNRPLQIPISSYNDKNDMPIRRIDRSNLVNKRKECDIILLLEESYQKNYQWIKPGYNELNKYGENVDNLIICGISYWECDREEIDYILDNINENAFITIVNKNENRELMEKIYSKFDRNKVQILDLDEFLLKINK